MQSGLKNKTNRKEEEEKKALIACVASVLVDHRRDDSWLSAAGKLARGRAEISEVFTILIAHGLTLQEICYLPTIT